MNAMRISLLLGIIVLFTLGARESTAPAQDPAAQQGGYHLAARADGKEAPALSTDLDLGAPFAIHKGSGSRVLVIGGQIDVSNGGKFQGTLTCVDYTVLKDGVQSGWCATSHVELELGKPSAVNSIMAGGITRSITITLTKKPSR
jgi:hypothetical protein